jgi:hypothetical protein
VRHVLPVSLGLKQHIQDHIEGIPNDLAAACNDVCQLKCRSVGMVMEVTSEMLFSDSDD